MANGALDPHDLVQTRVEVVSKSVSGSGSDRSNHVDVTDWREGHEGKTDSFQLFEPELFKQLQKGDQVILSVGPGLFGAWYEGMAPVPNEGSR